MARAEAPEYALLTAASKRLVRRIGETGDHRIVSASGEPGAGWRLLEDQGWVKLRIIGIGGYEVQFTLSGWERWCRQCDAEDGSPLQPIEFE